MSPERPHRIRTVVVDDEPLARELLRDLLKADPDVEVAAECGDGKSAAEAIRRHHPELVFLDVEMPESDGLEVAAALPERQRPVVVFVTAYGEHAPRAFDLEALDYVVKPYSDARLRRALDRAKRRVREKRLGALAGRLATLTAELEGPTEPQTPSRYLSRLTVPGRDRSLILDCRDLIWIESCDYYVKLHTRRGNHLLRRSLTDLERHLDPASFARVHRGAIVNLGEVVEVEHLPKGARQLVLSDGSRQRVSRSRQKVVEGRLVGG